MADVETEVAAAGVPKKRTFKKFSFRGVDLDALLDMSTDELVKLFPARARRRFQRGLKRKPMALIKKLRKAKREAPPGEKPEPVRTHLRNMIIVPEMIGSIIGVYNGKTFNQVEIKPEMISHYLAEFSISYKPVKHGRPGIGATHSSSLVVLSVLKCALGEYGISERDLGHDGSLRASVGKRSPEYSTRSHFLAAMGSTCKQGKPNGNQKMGGYRIGQKTIQKAKAHPAEGRSFGSSPYY
ncbi:hypothetical protein V6N13_047508 [Hibiscus sabdariffa]